MNNTRKLNTKQSILVVVIVVLVAIGGFLGYKGHQYHEATKGYPYMVEYATNGRRYMTLCKNKKQVKVVQANLHMNLGSYEMEYPTYKIGDGSHLGKFDKYQIIHAKQIKQLTIKTPVKSTTISN